MLGGLVQDHSQCFRTELHTSVPSFQWPILISVGNRLSFTGAARELRISVSAVSRQISLFEESVGGEVFVRSTKLVAFTPMGRRYHEAVKRLESQLQVNDTPLRIGLLQSVFDFFLLDFLKRHPKNLEGKLCINIGSPESLERLLESQKLDFLLTNRKPSSRHFDSHRLYREKLGLITQAGAKSIRNSRMILWTPLAELGSRFPSSQPPIEVSSMNAVLEMVRAGFGRAILPAGAARVSDPQLRFHPLEIGKFGIASEEVDWIWLVSPAYRTLPEREATVINLLKKESAQLRGQRGL